MRAGQTGGTHRGTAVIHRSDGDKFPSRASRIAAEQTSSPTSHGRTSIVEGMFGRASLQAVASRRTWSSADDSRADNSGADLSACQSEESFVDGYVTSP